MKGPHATIDDAIGEQNNFLLLRFIAASMVIYGHAPAIAGGYAPLDLFLWLRWGEYSGSIAVDVFFIVSGFLITQSFCRRQGIISFARARVVRIFPAYVVCLLFSAFVVGPIFSVHAFGDYFANPGSYAYVWTNLKLKSDMAWLLPGVFVDNPKQATVNGSLWTLPAEVRLYAWVAILGCSGAMRRRWLFNVVMAGLFLLGFFRPSLIPLIPIDAYVRLGALFAMGAFCYVNRSWIPLHGGFLLGGAAAAWTFRTTSAYPVLFAMCEVLFVFWFAYRTQWHGFNRLGDYSYGIYLWGFPMQQMLASIAPEESAPMNAVVAFVGALVLAFASWHLVEQPALRLKARRASGETPSEPRRETRDIPTDHTPTR